MSGWDAHALFVIDEEWLDRFRVRSQGAVKRVESVKGVFGAAHL